MDIKPWHCHVCLGPYSHPERRPRTLPCGHNFCTPCLNSLLAGAGLRCPTCRAGHHLAHTDTLPISYDLEAVARSISRTAAASPNTPGVAPDVPVALEGSGAAGVEPSAAGHTSHADQTTAVMVRYIEKQEVPIKPKALSDVDIITPGMLSCVKTNDKRDTKTNANSSEAEPAGSAAEDAAQIAAAGAPRRERQSGIGKKLRASLAEQQQQLVDTFSACHQAQEQLDQYRAALTNWTEQHLKVLQGLATLEQQNKQAVQQLQEEDNRVQAMQEAGRQDMQQVAEMMVTLATVRTPQDAFVATNDADYYGENAEDWTLRAGRDFPDHVIVLTAAKVQAATTAALGVAALGMVAGDTAATVNLEDSTLSVMEKVRHITHNVASANSNKYPEVTTKTEDMDTSPPHAPDTKASPISPPKASPISPPKASPISPPKASPISPPKASPISPPKASPISPPKASPISPPESSPTPPPQSFPTPAPNTSPTPSPKSSPTLPSKSSTTPPPKSSPTPPPKSSPSPPSKNTSKAKSSSKADTTTAASTTAHTPTPTPTPNPKPGILPTPPSLLNLDFPANQLTCSPLDPTFSPSPVPTPNPAPVGPSTTQDPTGLKERDGKDTDINTEGISIDELRNPDDRVKRLVLAGRVHAVRNTEGSVYSSKISFKNDRLYLHHLQDQTPPHDALRLQVGALDGGVDVALSTIAFLELSWGGQKRGRVHIRLKSNTPLAKQFAILCSGVRGLTYANTNFLSVGNKGKDGEYIIAGDYEHNDGTGGVHLLPSFNGRYRKSDQAGAVLGWYTLGGEKGAQFAILTQDGRRSDGKKYVSVFGEVESGMQALRLAAAYSKPHDVVIVDCGIVLNAEGADADP